MTNRTNLREILPSRWWRWCSGWAVFKYYSIWRDSSKSIEKVQDGQEVWVSFPFFSFSSERCKKAFACSNLSDTLSFRYLKGAGTQCLAILYISAENWNGIRRRYLSAPTFTLSLLLFNLFYTLTKLQTLSRQICTWQFSSQKRVQHVSHRNERANPLTCGTQQQLAILTISKIPVSHFVNAIWPFSTYRTLHRGLCITKMKDCSVVLCMDYIVQLCKREV